MASVSSYFLRSDDKRDEILLLNPYAHEASIFSQLAYGDWSKYLVPGAIFFLYLWVKFYLPPARFRNDYTPIVNSSSSEINPSRIRSLWQDDLCTRIAFVIVSMILLLLYVVHFEMVYAI